MSSVGAGFQAVTSIVSTLTNIDERMYLIEQDFEDLRNETMVSSDIAVLFSRLENLERLADGVSYFEERVIALETNYQNLDRRVSDLTYKVENLEAQFLSDGFGSGGYSLEEWEWLDLQKQLTAILSKTRKQRPEVAAKIMNDIIVSARKKHNDIVRAKVRARLPKIK